MELRVSEIHELVAARLRDEGQLYTSGRRQLVEFLVEAGRPSTISEVSELGPSLTQSSLYRNMAELENIGVLRRVVGADEISRYEFSVDIIGHHHHTICTTCGVIEDFHIASAAEARLEAALGEVLGKAGFERSGHRLDVFGICTSCD